MLATAGPLPTGPGWAYEFKWDGVRVIASISDHDLRLYARSGAVVTPAYPELAGLAGEVSDAVLDGEIVAFDAQGRPSFERLAERMHVRQPTRAAALATSCPVTYLIFDLLRFDGLDLTGLPYHERRDVLDKLDLGGDDWQVPPGFDDGEATMEASREYGLEGVMAKRVNSTYQPGLRTPDWVKVKPVNTTEVVIGGWRPGERPLGSLLVGQPLPDGSVAYQGRVGGGLTDRMIRQLLQLLRPLRIDRSPFADPVPREDAKGAVWVRPEVVIEVAYGNQTTGGRLRFPRFQRLRPDLTVEDLRGESGAEA
jgi:bifunctional non-homologous end joining protein LigD